MKNQQISSNIIINLFFTMHRGSTIPGDISEFYFQRNSNMTKYTIRQRAHGEKLADFICQFLDQSLNS